MSPGEDPIDPPGQRRGVEAMAPVLAEAGELGDAQAGRAIGHGLPAYRERPDQSLAEIPVEKARGERPRGGDDASDDGAAAAVAGIVEHGRHRAGTAQAAAKRARAFEATPAEVAAARG